MLLILKEQKRSDIFIPILQACLQRVNDPSFNGIIGSLNKIIIDNYQLYISVLVNYNRDINKMI